MDMANFIDTALNFLKSRKEKSIMDSFIQFKDVQQSIAVTQGKSLTLDIFR